MDGRWFPCPAAAAKSLQSCPTLCDLVDDSLPGSPIPGILQARILEWVAISFSNAWKWKVKVKSLSRVQLLVTPRTAAHQAPPSLGFSRQEYWSGVPSPFPLSLLQWAIITTFWFYKTVANASFFSLRTKWLTKRYERCKFHSNTKKDCHSIVFHWVKRKKAKYLTSLLNVLGLLLWSC